ncbi:MAG: PDZ domain-containing protein [Steroidobacteraceae bacterium]
MAKMKICTAALAPFIVLSCTISVAHGKDPALLSLSMEHFRDTATVKDGPTDAVATITTENGYVEHEGLMQMVWNDEFLSGVIDKKTGQKSFQVDAWIIYSGNWRYYETANYRTTNGPRSVPTTQISKKSENCAVGNCMYTEHIAFPVDEELLRQLATGYAPAKPVIWRFKLLAKSGPEYRGGLSNAEIAGFLAKVDEYTRATPLVKESSVAKESTVKESAANASLRLEFGIGGMPIAATAEQPQRAGILVIAVNSGSVAQKSGIIVGDILYELGGRRINTLADLQAAVAACAAQSAVAIKLYRGTNEMAVTAQF